jgi:hypothetical protein
VKPPIEGYIKVGAGGTTINKDLSHEHKNAPGTTFASAGNDENPVNRADASAVRYNTADILLCDARTSAGTPLK